MLSLTISATKRTVDLNPRELSPREDLGLFRWQPRLACTRTNLLG